jgi:hypothetical protein
MGTRGIKRTGIAWPCSIEEGDVDVGRRVLHGLFKHLPSDYRRAALEHCV